MVTFSQLEAGDAEKALADASLLQLYRNAAFPQSGVTRLEDQDLSQYFSKGRTVTLAMPKDLGEAQDYDDRSGVDATTDDSEHMTVELTLEKLFTRGHSVYSPDANVARYIEEFSETQAGAIRKSVDDYFYLRTFRSWTLAATGDITLGGHPPTTIVFREDANGVLQDFGDDLLLSAGAALYEKEVPETNRYARLSTRAAQKYLGTITPVTGSALTEGQIALGRQMLQQANYMSSEFDMRGFMIRGSNGVTGQTAVADTGDGNPSEAIGAVDAVTAGNNVIAGDQASTSGDTSAGAIRLTITQTANLAAGIAVGKIARIGPDAGAATAYGVILRVDAANKYVYLIPYDKDGNRLVAGQITPASDKFSVRAIGSINPAYHREMLAYANRLIREPNPGEGAVAERAVDRQLGLVMQVFRGSFNVHQAKSGIRAWHLCGCTPTDYRKGTLMLSN